jgi:hypothetical protein
MITAPASVAAQVEKIKSKIEKIGVRGDLTVKLTNGKTYHGFVSQIGADDFEIVEVDIKTSILIRFDSVRSIEKGYGEKGPLGNRVGKKGRLFGKVAIISLAAFVTIVAVVGLSDNRN